METTGGAAVRCAIYANGRIVNAGDTVVGIIEDQEGRGVVTGITETGLTLWRFEQKDFLRRIAPETARGWLHQEDIYKIAETIYEQSNPQTPT